MLKNNFCLHAENAEALFFLRIGSVAIDYIYNLIRHTD